MAERAVDQVAVEVVVRLSEKPWLVEHLKLATDSTYP